MHKMNATDTNVEIDKISRSSPASVSLRAVFFDFLWVWDVAFCVLAGFLGSVIYRTFVLKATEPNHLGGIFIGFSIGIVFALYSGRMRRYEASAVLASNRMSSVAEPITRAWLIAIFVTLTIVFLAKQSELLSRGVMLVASPLALIFLILWRRISGALSRQLTRSGRSLCLRTAVIGPAEKTEEVTARFADEECGVDILTTVEFDTAAGRPEEETQTLLTEFIASIREQRIEQIIVAGSITDLPGAYWLSDQLSLAGVPVAIAFERDFQRLMEDGTERIGQHRYIQVRPHSQNSIHGLIKRVFDVCFAFVMLVLLSPLMLAIAIAVKATSKGPIIFAQQRHGRGHQIFKIYKFRSMTALDDGANVEQAQKNDPRVTRIGSILRRTSLDELPQFFNVLKGEMSVVGPRPHALTHNREHTRVVRQYARRHNVRPGITGWAQVNGYRGETDSTEKMSARVEHDLWYIRNWSLWLDFKIIVLTVIAVLFPKNAY